tara:strand:- start:372 stop:602 length:231 start_codon:yes stop_codon:yes gene_type:complete
LSAPINVEINTAGIAINIEFQKKGLKPSHWIPVQAEDQAVPQASKVTFLGKDTKLPVLISSKLFRDVVIITNKGRR